MRLNFSLIVTTLALSWLINVESQAKTLKIVTSINPIYQITKFIADDADNYLIAPSNLSEHHYNMRPSDIKSIEQADLIFLISADLETSLAKTIHDYKSFGKKLNAIELIKSSPGLKILDSKFTTSRQDPHIWLNPDNAVIIAGLITDRISAINPERSLHYKKKLQDFSEQVRNNKEEISHKLEKLRNINYLVYYDEYRYFEDYYQLKADTVVLDYHGQLLSINNLKRINTLIKNNQSRCLLSELKEDSGPAKQIAQDNKIQLVVTDILGTKISNPRNGYVEIIKNLSDDFIKCLSTN